MHLNLAGVLQRQISAETILDAKTGKKLQRTHAATRWQAAPAQWQSDTLQITHFGHRKMKFAFQLIDHAFGTMRSNPMQWSVSPHAGGWYGSIASVGIRYATPIGLVSVALGCAQQYFCRHESSRVNGARRHNVAKVPVHFLVTQLSALIGFGMKSALLLPWVIIGACVGLGRSLYTLVAFKPSVSRYHTLPADPRNDKTFEWDDIDTIPPKLLFVTQTRHVFDIRELIIFNLDKETAINAYTNSPLSARDLKALLEHPSYGSCLHQLKTIDKKSAARKLPSSIFEEAQHLANAMRLESDPSARHAAHCLFSARLNTLDSTQRQWFRRVFTTSSGESFDEYHEQLQWWTNLQGEIGQHNELLSHFRERSSEPLSQLLDRCLAQAHRDRRQPFEQQQRDRSGASETYPAAA